MATVFFIEFVNVFAALSLYTKKPADTLDIELLYPYDSIYQHFHHIYEVRKLLVTVVAIAIPI